MASEVFVAREDSVTPVNAVNGSSFGETFDRRNAGAARAQARTALDGAVTPRLYGTTTINLGVQGSAAVRRVGTERRGSLQTTLNGENIGKVDYNEDGRGMFKKSADDAFKEVKRRIGYRVYT